MGNLINNKMTIKAKKRYFSVETSCLLQQPHKRSDCCCCWGKSPGFFYPLTTHGQRVIVRLHINNAIHVIQHKITIHCETKTHKQKVIVRLHINNAVHVIQQYKKPLRKHSCIKLHQMSPLPLHLPTPYSRTSRNR